jgi:hypothetical protein
MSREALFLLAKVVIYKWVNFQAIRLLSRTHKATIIKSFLYKRSFNEEGEWRDIIFDSLIKEYKSRNQKVFSVFELESCFKLSLKNNLAESPINYLAFVSIHDFFICYLSSFFGLLKWRKVLTDPVDNLIQDNYLIETASANFFHNKLYYYAFKGLFKRCDLGKVIYTFENNGWERMLCLAAKRYSSKTMLIGHQHVPISPLAINCYTTKNELKNSVVPNKIVTTGSKPVQFFIDRAGFPKDMIREGCAVRFKAYPDNEVKTSDLKKPRILVAVDGLYFSSFFINRLLEIDEFIVSKGIEVVIRYHQSINHNGMKNLLISDVLEKKHYSISNSTLQEDFKLCDIVLYWGTSVAFEALRYGIALIHCPGKELMSNDPLYGFEDLKWTASNSNELKEILIKLMETDVNQINERRRRGLNFVVETLKPVSSEALNPFFEN